MTTSTRLGILPLVMIAIALVGCGAPGK